MPSLLYMSVHVGRQKVGGYDMKQLKLIVLDGKSTSLDVLNNEKR